MRILVTGGAGFIGSHIAKKLAEKGHGVVVVDDFSSGNWKNLIHFPGDVATCDIATHPERIEKLGPFDLISHQAAITDTTVMDQHKMMHNNVEAFRHLLRLAEHWGTARIVWASSASIYGGNQAPNVETQDPDPLNVYAYSKLVKERMAHQWSQHTGRRSVGLRYFNVYGPGEDHKGKFASMIHQLAKQMRAGKRPRIFTAGQQKRDFVYIEDVVTANLKAMECPKSGVFNVGSGVGFSFNQVVQRLNEVLGTKLEPDYFENPYNFTQDHTQADVEHAREGLGYVPAFDPVKGIAAYHASGALGIAC
ncbi:MAG TPA: NAD-dependent epimerase/dehydratase family protein [Tepidisphaeraceae bacterium]|nr:NAD-dependent epimerase/dehydratase family protein [Tepidisphaeraceae bacterium]